MQAKKLTHLFKIHGGFLTVLILLNAILNLRMKIIHVIASIMLELFKKLLWQLMELKQVHLNKNLNYAKAALELT